MKLHPGWKEVQNDYKITKFLGKGSYGQVMQAKRRDSQKIVAIKMIECSVKNLNTLK